ncbi:MAG: type II toxin-antitoxin system VapC family toxin [Chloroflexi bacterium]|nr:type II toxin-antitoxin system VapC family toxin [Chloroflexota bacterium]
MPRCLQCCDRRSSTSTSPRKRGEEAFSIFCRLGIRPVHRPDLHLRAWEIAKELNTPRVYDMHCVALAELEGCELYTADRGLLRKLGARRRWAKGIGGF